VHDLLALDAGRQQLRLETLRFCVIRMLDSSRSNSASSSASRLPARSTPEVGVPSGEVAT